jgi:spermidine synthase
MSVPKTMIETMAPSAPPSDPFARRLPLLLLLFFGSGLAALIYEIVWFQMLQLIIGSSAVSLAVLLGTYMGGLGLGGLLLPRLIPARIHPLRVYAGLELGIGLLGLAVLFGLPILGRFYMSQAGAGFGGLLLRGTICAAGLILPTLLMGATLPAVARWVESTPQGAPWLGFLYAANTGGAVGGCLLAGFYLLRFHDLGTATIVAAAVNGSIAGLSWLVAGRSPRPAPIQPAIPAESDPSSRPGKTWMIHVAIALSGLAALGAEVIWTRVLGLILGGTVYAFALILAVFLAGLAAGGGLGGYLSRRKTPPRLILGYCQFLLAGAIAWTAYQLAQSLPYWPISPALTQSPWLHFQLDLVRGLWAALPPTILWGASFPLALAAVSAERGDWGKRVGGVYASNTAGTIVGAVGFSLILIPRLGTAASQRILIFVSLAAGLFAFLPVGRRADQRPAPISLARAVGKAAGWTLAAIAAVALAMSVPGVPWELIAYGRQLPTKAGQARILYVGEGLNSSVAVTELESGDRNFHVSGKVEASSVTQDMRLQRMLGHLPTLLHPHPKSVLVVGCGAGVTAGSFVLPPGVERIVICEIEPLIPKVVARYFGRENFDVLDDPRVEVVLDDARHYILTTKETFDIITTDPINPWIKGSAALYSREYYERCRTRLNPGGVIAQWVPLYESTTAAVKSEAATFFSVFPGGTIWSNDFNGQGYDVILLGRERPALIDVDAMEERIGGPGYEALAGSLKDIGFRTAVQLLATYAGRDGDLKIWLKDASINLDRNLRLQYLAGLGANAYLSYSIYDEMVSHYRFPDDLFSGTPETLEALKSALALFKKETKQTPSNRPAGR